MVSDASPAPRVAFAHPHQHSRSTPVNNPLRGFFECCEPNHAPERGSEKRFPKNARRLDLSQAVVANTNTEPG